MGRGHAIAVLVPVVAFAVYTPARILWQHGELRWRHHVIEAPQREAATARPPARPLRIAFVADLQQDRHTDEALATRIMRRLQESRPDLVLSGGDWINMGPDHIDAAARTAALLTSPLGTYTVRGDHEHFAFTDQDRSVQAVTEAMRARGVHMVHNEVRRFQHDGRTIAVAFLTYSYPAPTAWTEIARLIAELDGADLKVLVTHQLSDTTMALARDRVDLVLAAHTHGGQVNPVIGLWHVPLARLETRYIDGRYQVGGTTVVVTAGIGYSLVPFRYASPGSVETLEVRWP
jgi:predicted MPP superfamily phosphohydrolase